MSALLEARQISAGEAGLDAALHRTVRFLAVLSPAARTVQEAAQMLELPSAFTPAGDLAPALAEMEEQFGAARGDANRWGSCIRIARPSAAALETAFVMHLENNEAALCMCLVTFASQGAGAAMLAVGTAKGLSFYPRSAEGAIIPIVNSTSVKSSRITLMPAACNAGSEQKGCHSAVASNRECILGMSPDPQKQLLIDCAGFAEGYIRIYKFAADGNSLQHVHTTPLGGAIPAALCEFQGRLLVGCGRSLRLMECGRKKMLRKCEYTGLPSIVMSIHTMGSRIYVGDAHESFHYLRFKKAENSFYIFADDSTPRCAPVLFQADVRKLLACSRLRAGRCSCNTTESETQADKCANDDINTSCRAA